MNDPVLQKRREEIRNSRFTAGHPENRYLAPNKLAEPALRAECAIMGHLTLLWGRDVSYCFYCGASLE